MNIQLHNYETFFLMYVDNELSAAEREMVEAFIGQYPYLQEELDTLQDTVLELGEAISLDKSALFRSAAMEEQLLLHLDNELSDEATKQLLRTIQSNETLQKDWKLLQQTKLDAQETYVFENKAVLLRKETRVIRLAYVRWAAAAALIAAGFFVGINLVNKQTDRTVAIQSSSRDNNLATQSSTGIEGKDGSFKGNDTSKQTTDDRLNVNQTINNGQQTGQYVNNASDAPSKKINRKSAPADKNLDQEPLKYTVNMNSPAVDQNNNQKTIAKNDVLIGAPVLQEEPKTIKTLAVAMPNAQPINSSYEANRILMASLNEDKVESNNHILLMDEDDVSRSKAGAFFKRIKRTVARSAGVKPGNSLKIAGFEFAVK